MNRARLDPACSLYLDISRLLAALLVLAHHVLQPPFFDGGLHYPGRASVIVFFVISGFVIAYASDGKRDWRDYAVARLGRIYSVALPALLLTLLLVLLAAVLGSGPSPDQPLVRLAVSLVFLNQHWNLTVAALSNGPYWSLCYEVWYYLMFGLALFAPRRWAWVAIALLLVFVGPRIVSLLPCWLLGVLLWHWQRGRSPATGVRASLGFYVALLVFLLLLFGGWRPLQPATTALDAELVEGYLPLFGVNVYLGGETRFVEDWLQALAFGATVAFSPAAGLGAWLGTRWEAGIRALAGHTFSLYLYHAPLLVFLYPLLAPHLPGAALPATLLALILASVALMARYTEQRKSPYERFFRRVLALKPSPPCNTAST